MPGGPDRMVDGQRVELRVGLGEDPLDADFRG
jgi:hypothetical protein